MARLIALGARRFPPPLVCRGIGRLLCRVRPQAGASRWISGASLDFDQITPSQEGQHYDPFLLLGRQGDDVFEIDWTILASVVGLLISSFAAIWYARRHRD
jgi:hypothetical protein